MTPLKMRMFSCFEIAQGNMVWWRQLVLEKDHTSEIVVNWSGGIEWKLHGGLNAVNYGDVSITVCSDYAFEQRGEISGQPRSMRRCARWLCRGILLCVFCRWQFRRRWKVDFARIGWCLQRGARDDFLQLGRSKTVVPFRRILHQGLHWSSSWNWSASRKSMQT